MRDGRRKVGRLSVGRAITVGIIWVNGPIYPIMFGVPVGLLALVYDLGAPITLANLGAFIGSFVIGWLLAGLWWSINVPLWRLWAYERVDPADIPALKQRAVEMKLTWPDGHFLAKTEIKSKAHVARERELERGAPPR